MPFSTNVPDNEFGFRMQNRDIEQLYMLIQDLQNQLGAAPTGDLAPGGGALNSQALPDNMVGVGKKDAGTSILNFEGYVSGQLIAESTTTPILFTQISLDPPDAYDLTTGVFTAGRGGLYVVSVDLAIVSRIAVGLAESMAGSVQITPFGTGGAYDTLSIGGTATATAGTSFIQPSVAVSFRKSRRLTAGQTIVAQAFGLTKSLSGLSVSGWMSIQCLDASTG